LIIAKKNDLIFVTGVFKKLKKERKEERKLSVYIGVTTGAVTVPLTLTPLAV